MGTAGVDGLQILARATGGVAWIGTRPAVAFEKLRAEQVELGAKVRELLESRGFPSVAAEGWKAPGVVVSYTTDPDIHSGRKFIAAGLQTASGVPLQCGEGADFRTFRMGLFGLEKWHNVDRTVGHVAAALEKVAAT
jgi:aspartate aminotransferase-like enzyme